MVVEGLGPIKFHVAREIVVASDPKATRDVSYVRRMPSGTVELLSKRDGPSGTLWTLREIRAAGPEWRYLADGETLEDLEKDFLERIPEEFCGTVADSIADVTARHALSAIREIELSSPKTGTRN